MLDRIIETISLFAKIDKDLIGAETNVFDLEIDSLCFIKMIMDLENTFGVRFEDEEIVEIKTAKDIENTILKKFS